jgi:PUA domain protein
MSFKIKNRHRLKTKQIKNLQSELYEIFETYFFNEKSSVEIGDYEEYNVIFIDSEPCFIFYKNNVIFTLYGINKFKPKNNYVIVDMGAVKFVTNGADVMCPGIIDADKNIKPDQQVWICDEKNKKPLAVGISEINGEQMITEEKGKAISTIHWVGDKLWNFTAKSL